MSALRIGILAYPGCFASEVYGVLDLLTTAGHVVTAARQTSSPFEARVVSPRRQVVGSGGAELAVRAPGGVDLLIVPGFEAAAADSIGPHVSTLGIETDIIRSHLDDGLPLASVCIGAFLLGAAGALDGRTCTTSWLHAAQLQQRHPAANVEAHRLVVTDDGVSTAAAFSAMFDLVLDLTRRECGEDIARMTARIALLHARESQAPYVDGALLPEPDTGSVVQAAKRTLLQDLAGPYDLNRLAQHCHVSSRTLLRRFRQEAGESPLEYLQRARIRKAMRLLERTDRSLAEIRRMVGYRDPGAFRALFGRYAGMGPLDYRAGFRDRAAG